MASLERGLLIAIEGIDGSGKSTLAHTMAQKLSLHVPTLLTKEPGGTELGKTIRSLLQEQQTPITPIAEYLLFAADRAHHFATVVIPALHQKKLVISDRLADSSLVYQGYARGLDRSMIATANAWAMQNITPNLVIYVRTPAHVARERLLARGKLSAFEQEQEDFTHKLIQGFEELYAHHPNVIVVDGTAEAHTLAEHVHDRIITWLTTNKTVL